MLKKPKTCPENSTECFTALVQAYLALPPGARSRMTVCLDLQLQGLELSESLQPNEEARDSVLFFRLALSAAMMKVCEDPVTHVEAN